MITVAAKLAEQKIIVTKKPQGIRVSTHFFNNEDDIERLIEGLSIIKRSPEPRPLPPMRV